MTTIEDPTPIQEFYKGKTVFITGGSGFMGKVRKKSVCTNSKQITYLSFLQVLIEKLLYSCSDLKEILVLVRPKKGKAPESRLEDMFKLPVNTLKPLSCTAYDNY